MNKTHKWQSGLLVVFMPFVVAIPAQAQDSSVTPVSTEAPVSTKPLVPGPSGNLDSVPLLSKHRVHLDGKEAHGLALANKWKHHQQMPIRGANGNVQYLYGATLPTLVCTPLEVCAVKLQRGEVVNDAHAGDPVRWKISPATQGKRDDQTTYVVVKPVDVGLSTNLFITTDRRAYTIKLVSTKKSWIPVLSFDYPDDIKQAWADYRERIQRKERAEQAAVARNTMSSGQNLADLDFDFTMRGDHPSWMPERVYSDGHKTYIQFPTAEFGNGAPALVALGNDEGLFHGASKKLVNYRVIGDRYVVDQVLDRAALITGVGSSQEEVIIQHGSR